MILPQGFIEKVKDANNIVDIIASYTEIKRSGQNTMALCPFPDHKEKTPSFSISESKQVYYCFGCKKSGNIYNFLMDYNGMSFHEAVEFLAKKASIPLPANDHAPKKELDKNIIYKLNLFAGSFYKKRLHELSQDHIAKKYLKTRNLHEDIIEKFKIGYAPHEWSALVLHLENLKAPLYQAEAAGLVKKRNTGKEYFDLFRDRIMFPILSPKGDVIGFGGRIINEGQPKYLNSPESVVFHKGKTLYGLNETAKYIKSEDQAIVVEGYMDLLALYQYGFKNVVATLGTALTPDHAKLLKRYTQNILVLFDGDAAGQAAQEKSLNVLLNEGLLPKGILLPDEYDPDEFLKEKGAEEFKKLLVNAPDLFLIVMSKIMQDYRPDPTEREKRIRIFSPILNCIPSKSLKDLYVQEVATELGVNPNWLSKNLISTEEKITTRSSSELTQHNEDIDLELIDASGAPKEELILLNLALYDQSILNELLDGSVFEKFRSIGIKKLFGIILAEYRQKGTNFDRLTSLLCSRVRDTKVVTDYLDEGIFQNVDIKKLKGDCLQRVIGRFLNDRAKRLVSEIKLNNDPQKLEQFMNIIRDKQALKQTEK